MLTFISYLRSALPVLAGALVFALAVCAAAVFAARRRGKPLTAGRTLWLFLAAAYLFALMGLLVFRTGAPGNVRSLNLELFFCYREAVRGFSSLDMINILMNILIFLPFGFLAALPFGESRRRWLVIPLGFALSLAAETLQYFMCSGIADVDDLFNNTLGVICGFALARFCLAARAGRVRMSAAALLLTLLCLSPPFITLALSAASPYGASEFDRTDGVSLAGREIRFSDEAEGFLSGLALTPPDVYAAKGGSLEDAYAEADEFFGRFGLERSAGDETLYDDDAWLYSTGRDYFLRYEYTGPVLLYRRMGTSGVDTGDRFSEDDIRAGAAAWSVEIPEEAVMGRGEDGSFIFELEPGGNRGGSVVVRCNAEGVCEISCRLYDLRRIAAAEPPAAAECVSALEHGEYSCWDEIPAGDIVIGSASVEYTLDSKGCYRPVLFLSCGAAELHIPMAIA